MDIIKSDTNNFVDIIKLDTDNFVDIIQLWIISWIISYGIIQFHTVKIYSISMNLVCPLHYAHRMFISSFLLIMNVMDGYSKGLYDCSILILICWINSINYWRFPVHGIRRNIDLLSAIIATYYHYLCSFEIINGNIYRIGMTTFIGWYGLALYFGRICNKKHYASICHVNIHSTALVFNTWLFSQLYIVRY